MSEDLTRRFDGQEDSEKLTQILAILQSLDTHVQSLDAGVENLDTHVQSLDTHVENVDKLVGSIGERLGDLEQKVDLRPYDTRPIWEKVQTDIIQLQEGQQRFQEGQEFLRRESHEIHTMLRDIFRRLSIFNDTLITMQADYRDIYDRIRDIERPRT